MANNVREQLEEAAQLYRYRTPALVGPWRKTEIQALRDAMRARQAMRDERDRRAVRWLVPGQIEQMEAHRGRSGAVPSPRSGPATPQAI